MKLSLSALILFLLFQFKLYSQPVYFETSWGGTDPDFARSVRQLSSGDIYVFGYSGSGTNGGVDYALNKLDRYGNLKWTKYYGGSLDDNGLSMNITADGNFIVTGESYATSTDLDILTCKIDTSGTMLWSKRYATTANESARSIIQTADGGYALCGFRNDPTGSNDSYIIKINSSGDTLWTKMVGGADNEYATALAETPGGKLFVSADTRSFGAGGYDVEVFMLDPLSGIVLWDSTYGDTVNNGTQGTKMSADGNIFTWGETEVTLFSPFDFYIQKTDTLGHLKWKKNFGGIKADAAFSLTELADSSLLFTGYSNSYNPGPNELVVFKTDASGNMKWIRNYGDAGIDIGYEIIPSIYNGFLICGQTFRSTDDFYLLHLDTAGTISGVQNLNNAGNIFSVYPNPSSGTFSIGSIGTYTVENILYVLRTPLGGEVGSGMVANNQLSFHQMIPSGIYFLELKWGNFSEMKKLIISR